MKPPVEHVRVSKQARDQLITLKRATGIQNWNVLCRWALIASLRDPSHPVTPQIKTDSPLEMTWKVFCGEHANVMLGLFMSRCQHDGIDLSDANILASEFRTHLHRGISLLSSLKNEPHIEAVLSKLLT